MAKKEPYKQGDLGKVIDEAGFLRDAVLAGDFMGMFNHSKVIADEFWTALYPKAPVPMETVFARFKLAKAEEPCVCNSKEELAEKIEEVRTLAAAGDGKWLSLFAKILPIILTLLMG